MPPIPSTLDADARELILALERKLKDLQDFQIPRLRTCKGPLATQQQYASELREDTEAFAKQVEALDLAVEDQRGERSRRELRQLVEKFRESLARLRKDGRAALLTSKRVIDSNALSNREELLRSSAVREKQSLSEQVAEDALMTATNNVTESLQRTLGIMQGELEKSVLSSQLLDASTTTLRSTSETHDTLDSLLQTSKHLVTALEKSDWLDRLLIIAALVFFILVVLFIVQQRIVNRGLRMAFWWTRFLPGTASKQVVAASTIIKSSASATLADAFTSTASTALTTAVLTSLLPTLSSSSTVPASRETSGVSVEISTTVDSVSATPITIETSESPAMSTPSSDFESLAAETSLPPSQHDEL